MKGSGEGRRGGVHLTGAHTCVVAVSKRVFTNQPDGQQSLEPEVAHVPQSRKD